MAERRKSITRTVLRKLVRPIPVIGEAAVLLTAASVLRRKGLVGGGLDIALDSIPIVGTAKSLLELATGDLIPDKRAAAPQRGDEQLQDVLPKAA